LLTIEKNIALRQVDDAPYKVEWKLYVIKNCNDFKTDLKGVNTNMQQHNVQTLRDVELF
jgi:hypothetical protein